MVEYSEEDVVHLIGDQDILEEYEDILLIVAEKNAPLSEKEKRYVYSSYLRSDYYQKYEDTDQITNLINVKVNRHGGVLEYDVITSSLDVLETNWEYLSYE